MSTAADRYRALFPMAQEIALQLTKLTKTEWIAQAQDPTDFWNYIKITAGDAELSITEDRGRLQIHGNTPRDPKTRQYVRVYVQSYRDGKPYGWDEFKFSSISVAVSKSAETIAKDIQRRFLPDYLKAVALTIERIQRDAQDAADKRTNLEACAATLHEVLRSDMRPIHGCDDVYEPLGSFSASIGNDIRIEVQADSKTT